MEMVGHQAKAVDLPVLWGMDSAERGEICGYVECRIEVSRGVKSQTVRNIRSRGRKNSAHTIGREHLNRIIAAALNV